MIRKAKAVWHGSGRAGNGDLSTDSGVLANTPYSFRTRFENEEGTNPEELLAAAHAGMNPAGSRFHESRSCHMSRDTPAVFVVDDDISVRESLESLIRVAGWQPRTFGSAQEFLSHPRALVPSCLVLDVTLPDLNGLDLQKRIAADRIEMPIIFITGYGDVPTTVRAMKAGAVEFLIKPYADEVLLSAIQQAIECSRAALRREAEMRSIKGPYASLSRRERQVMGLVVRGMLNKQVGGELGISEITVKAHRGNVMRKMKAGSFADLVNMAWRLHLASTPKD
jgi:FixJ family two-component response regulator